MTSQLARLVDANKLYMSAAICPQPLQKKEAGGQKSYLCRDNYSFIIILYLDVSILPFNVWFIYYINFIKEIK
jgi:hypothetical protein